MNNLEIFKALANESRLKILLWLKNPKKHFEASRHEQENIDMEKIGVCVGDIQNKLGLTQSTTSDYLAILQKANLVIATRIGKWTFYRRNEETIKKLSKSISKNL